MQCHRVEALCLVMGKSKTRSGERYTNGERTDEAKLAKWVPDKSSIPYPLTKIVPFAINNSLNYYYPSPRSNPVWVNNKARCKAFDSYEFLYFPPMLYSSSLKLLIFFLWNPFPEFPPRISVPKWGHRHLLPRLSSCSANCSRRNLLLILTFLLIFPTLINQRL